MNASLVQTDPWGDAPKQAPSTLVVDVAGFEGPLDLLLDLARSQKVDLARISVLRLAEQYLAFIERICELRLEVAGDYLVMAAWLAYLKSRLLLPPEPTDEEPTGAELAAALALRLRRLEAMRHAAALLMDRDRLGRNVFARGMPEIRIERRSKYQASLYDLLAAYANQRRRQVTTMVRLARRAAWSLGDARRILVRFVGKVADWTPLNDFLAAYLSSEETRRTALASSFGASLELAREGKLELRQAAAFAPLMIRSVAPAAEGTHA